MDEYSEYFTTRKPTSFGEKILTWWHQRMLNIAAKYIPDFHQKNILEIGAGHGFFADICKSKKMTYAGHEMNAQQAQILKEKGHDVSVATVPPIPNGNKAQVIWLSHVIEHASTYTEAKQMLMACYQRLDLGGFIVIIAPDIHHWKSHFWSVDWSHGFPTSCHRIEQLLNETGFSIHRSMHHTFTITQSLFAYTASLFFQLLPYNLIDSFLKKFTSRTFAYSFMSVLGWRQIYLIGLKPEK